MASPATPLAARRYRRMTPPDDIPLIPDTTQTERPPPSNANPSHRSVGPESEVRGGPEAAEQTIEETKDDP